MIFIFNVIFISSCVLLISAVPEYSYENADKWADEYPECGGSFQSPIDVSLDLVDDSNIDSDIEPLIFKRIHSTVPERMTLENDGHTVKLLFHWPNDTEKTPYVYGRLLEGKYILHSFQFRWGDNVDKGSEHQLGGKSFAMEMQAVHYNMEYASYEEAESSKNGLMINSKIEGKDFEFLTKIINKLPEVGYPGLTTEIEPFALGEYFIKDYFHYHVVYQGSLTHPPCTESVTWIVTSAIIPVSEEQVRVFHELYLFNEDTHNNRPLQPIDDRTGHYVETL